MFISDKVKLSLTYGFILAVVATLIWCILWDANWIFGDDHQILATTAINKTGLHGHRGGGRYWPLGLWDYNLLVFIPGGSSPFGHYLYNSVTLLLSFAVMGRLLSKIVVDRLRSFYFMAFSLFTLSLNWTFLQIHMDVIFSERMMILLFSVFALFYLKAVETQKKSHYFIAALSACYLTYCKEPVFGALIVISLTNLFFGYKKMPKNELIFYCFLIVNSLIYAIQWFFLEFLVANKFYNVIFSARIPLWESILKTSNNMPVLYIIFLASLIRAYKIIVKQDKESLHFDGLLFGALSYSVAFVVINMFHLYYFIISVWLAIPPLAHWANKLIKQGRAKLIVPFILSISILQLNSGDVLIKSVESIHQCRKEDVKVIKMLVDMQKSGAEVVFFEDKSFSGNGWYYTIWNTFLICETKINDKLKKITDLKDASDNHVVIYFSEKKSQELEDRNFVSIVNTRVGNIYAKKRN